VTFHEVRNHSDTATCSLALVRATRRVRNKSYRMGIPHLITSLESFAESQSLAGQDVIIDGPAFAYHVYHSSMCMGAKAGVRGAFEVVPSYHEISTVAIEWLRALERHGASM